MRVGWAVVAIFLAVPLLFMFYTRLANPGVVRQLLADPDRKSVV